MPYELMIIITTILQVKLPGGIEAFKEAGGIIALTPERTPTLMIYHPNLPSEVKDAITEAFKKMSNITVRFVATKNYEHRENLDDVYQELGLLLSDHMMDQLFIKSARTQVTPLYLAILMEGENTTDATARELADRIHAAIPDIIRIYVVYHDGCVCREYVEGQEPMTSARLLSKSVLTAEHPKRDTVIRDDDILNVKIALETAMDVNDFLKSM